MQDTLTNIISEQDNDRVECLLDIRALYVCADAGQSCRLDIMKSVLRKPSLSPVLFIKSYIREHCELQCTS